MKLHKTQEIAIAILKIFDKEKLRGEEAMMVVALIFREMGRVLKQDPQPMMKSLHAALVELAKSTKDTEKKDLIYKLQ